MVVLIQDKQRNKNSFISTFQRTVLNISTAVSADISIIFK